MTTDIKELVKRLRDVQTRERILGFGGSETLLLFSTEAADALEALAGEVARIRVALDIEHDDLNPVTMAETWVNKARVLDDQVVSLLAERDRLKAVLQEIKNDPVIAVAVAERALGDAS